MLAIRTYVPCDANVTRDIFRRSILEVASRDYTPDQVVAWAQVEDRDAWAKRRAGRSTWIATYNERPVGFSDLESRGHIDMMFVYPDFQRQGVASLLLGVVVRAAHEKEIPIITTDSSLTARPFFLGKDFDVVAAKEVRRRGQMFTNFRMEKRLSTAC